MQRILWTLCVGMPLIYGSMQRNLLQQARRCDLTLGSCDLSVLANGNGTQGFVIQGATTKDESGSSVGLGDFNGDGLADVIVGAPSNRTQAGRAFVIFGSRNNTAWANGTLDLATLGGGQGLLGFVIQGINVGYSSFTGIAVSSAGDVNGDGIDDMIVGAENATPLNRFVGGCSYVIFGSSNNSAWATGIFDLSTLETGQGKNGFVMQGVTNDKSGSSVSSAGDFNGDGLADLLVGAKGEGSSNGGAYVIFGSRTNSAWSTGILDLGTLAASNGTNGFVILGSFKQGDTGNSVASARDFNGDGLADIIVGAYLASSAAGCSYVIFGSRNNSAWSTGVLNLGTLAASKGANGFVIAGTTQLEYSGVSVSSGDINGDGLSDVIIGAHLANYLNRTEAGRTYVVFGSRTNNGWMDGTLSLNTLADGNGLNGFVFYGAVARDYSGVSVSSGDVNGDDVDDVLIGAYLADPFVSFTRGGNAGSTYVIFGSRLASIWSKGYLDLATLTYGQSARGFFIGGASGGENSGYSVSSGGDFNGDGFDDIIVGAYGAAPLLRADAGSSYLLFGTTGLSSSAPTPASPSTKFPTSVPPSPSLQGSPSSTNSSPSNISYARSMFVHTYVVPIILVWIFQ